MSARVPARVLCIPLPEVSKYSKKCDIERAIVVNRGILCASCGEAIAMDGDSICEECNESMKRSKNEPPSSSPEANLNEMASMVGTAQATLDRTQKTDIQAQCVSLDAQV